MKTVAFDLGGVLREVYGDNSLDNVSRHYDEIKSMYRLFIKSPGWKVAIVTHRPSGVRASEANVRAELRKHNIPYPNELLITDIGKKMDLYKQLNPDLVFDDKELHIREARAIGATAFKVM